MTQGRVIWVWKSEIALFGVRWPTPRVFWSGALGASPEHPQAFGYSLSAGGPSPLWISQRVYRQNLSLSRSPIDSKSIYAFGRVFLCALFGTFCALFSRFRTLLNGFGELWAHTWFPESPWSTLVGEHFKVWNLKCLGCSNGHFPTASFWQPFFCSFEAMLSINRALEAEVGSYKSSSSLMFCSYDPYTPVSTI